MQQTIQTTAVELVDIAGFAGDLGAILGLVALNAAVLGVGVLSRRRRLRWLPAVVLACMLYSGSLGMRWAMGVGAGLGEYALGIPSVPGWELRADGEWVRPPGWKPFIGCGGRYWSWDSSKMTTVTALWTVLGPCPRCEKGPLPTYAEAVDLLDTEGGPPWLLDDATFEIHNGGQYNVLVTDLNAVVDFEARVGRSFACTGTLATADLQRGCIQRAAEVRPGLLVVEMASGDIQLRRWDRFGSGRIDRQLSPG